MADVSEGQEPWGEVELEPEVEAWLDSLPDRLLSQAVYHINLLEQFGVLLAEPVTRQLRRKLRELRSTLGGQHYRITYYIAQDRRIILLTVFRKTGQREPAEIDRAERAMRRCIAEGHTAAEDET